MVFYLLRFNWASIHNTAFCLMFLEEQQDETKIPFFLQIVFTLTHSIV